MRQEVMIWNEANKCLVLVIRINNVYDYYCQVSIEGTVRVEKERNEYNSFIHDDSFSVIYLTKSAI
jgi:hypothetical protein